MPAGKAQWEAEVFVRWSALGFAPKGGASFKADFAINGANSAGNAVDERSCWSNKGVLTVSDLGIEAKMTPGAWGTMRLK